MSRQEYEHLLREIGAELLPEPVQEHPYGWYDAQLGRDGWVVLFHFRDEHEVKRWSEGWSLEKRAAIVSALGNLPETWIDITSGHVLSLNLILDFLLTFAGHAPCIIDVKADPYTLEELLEIAIPGFDGYHWDPVTQRIAKVRPKTEQERRYRSPGKVLEGPWTPTRFTLYSTIKLSREEYERLLYELHAETISGGEYDAHLSRGIRHLWLSSLSEEALTDALDCWDDEEREIVSSPLGGRPHAGIAMEISDQGASLNLAIEFVIACASRFPCIVLAETRTWGTYNVQEFAEFARPGYDGYHWDRENKCVLKDNHRTDEGNFS